MLFSREELENTLLDYTGTMLIVSHDRYFINKLSTRILELNQNGVKEYLGNYDYFYEKKMNIDSQDNSTPKSKPAIKVNDYKLKKEQAAEQRKLKTQLKRTEELIETLEQEIVSVESILNSEEVQSDYEKLLEYTEMLRTKNEELEELYLLWEEIQEKITE